MDYTRFLNSKPSIKLHIVHGGQEGTINLCSAYGCYDKESNIDLIDNEIVNLTCPYCKKDLAGSSFCRKCNAPIVDFNLSKGGMVHVCSRIGCTNHYVSFDDIYDTLTNFYQEYGYGADEHDF